MPLQNQFDFAADVIEAFTEGDCWALAEEVQKLTGWDIVGLGTADEAGRSASERYWEHMAVRRPDGSILDITGLHGERGWLEGWNSGFVRNTVVFEANDPAYREEMIRSYRKSPSHWAKRLLASAEVAEER